MSHHLDDVEFWDRCPCLDDPVISHGMYAVRLLVEQERFYKRPDPSTQVTALARLARTGWIQDEEHRRALLEELGRWLPSHQTGSYPIHHVPIDHLARFVTYLLDLPVRAKLGRA